MSILFHSKPRIAVLRGGPSEEYSISLVTGEHVLSALQRLEYQPLDIVVTKRGDWIQDGMIRTPETIANSVDMVFIALHGPYGEDGQLQRILDRLAVPYTGSTAFASSLAMNKMVTKEHLRAAKIAMAPHIRVTRNESKTYHRLANTIETMFGPEFVVKPNTGGSSIGTQMAAGVAELTKAIETALDVYEEVLVEKRIRGREATGGVVENFRDQSMYMLPEVEIVPPDSTDYFAAHVKYTGDTEEICPGRFTADEKQQVLKTAEFVHKTLGLRQYSRSDFMIADGKVYFLEVNTLPGLTPQSLFPKALQAVGCGYDEFIDHLVADTLRRAKKIA